ncbi:MAG: KpsF/GutQ family sugar-phosphate isomerase [Chitinophagales bacterium]
MEQQLAQQIINRGKQTLHLAAQAIEQTITHIDEQFVLAVQAILQLPSHARIVLTGVGKSALVGQKITATFNSTGTPALFMHAADAMHGDLGMIQAEDLILLISKSGTTAEIKTILPLLKQRGNQIIAIVGNVNTHLALQADFVLNTSIEQEADPNNLAPTTSTSVQMVMGDALAVCVLEQRGFEAKDFAQFHPGGTLGKRLYLKVADIYLKNERPVVQETVGLKEVIIEISAKRLGATAVLNKAGALQGIITDGDLRRALSKQQLLDKLSAKDIMTIAPKCVEVNQFALEALEIMQDLKITQLVVIEKNSYKGMIHLHDLVQEGLN